MATVPDSPRASRAVAYGEHCVLPLWPIPFTSALLAAARVRPPLLRSHRARTGRCPECGGTPQTA
jgi:hypothetical protein